jgi:putative transposase
MARPLRVEFAGALYHVTARGNRREEIYFDDQDRQRFLALLAEVCDRFNWLIHAYCLMTNHYHLVVETPDGNLSKGMRQLNGVYTQAVNRRHRRVGHVFQGRFKAILVQKEAYLLELGRYVVLNPVRARMVARAEDWPWSSCRVALGMADAPGFLDVEFLLSHFGSTRGAAAAAYRRFVESGIGRPSPLSAVRHQVILGDDAFVEQFNGVRESAALREVPKVQRRPIAGELADFAARYPDRREAMARAYRSGAYTMQEIADHFGVHYMTVSRAVRSLEGGMLDCET